MRVTDYVSGSTVTIATTNFILPPSFTDKTMSNADQKQETSDRGDSSSSDEPSEEDCWASTAGEEELQAAVKAIQDRAQAPAAQATLRPPAVDEFLRNFLLRRGMTETLSCFQTEWTELLHKGLLDTTLIGEVPDVYTDIKRLENELENARRERDEYSVTVKAADSTLERVRKGRELQRLQHKRLVQERDQVIDKLKMLRGQCARYERQVKKMNKKYKAVLEQTKLITQELEKAVEEVDHHLPTPQDPPIQPKPPTSGNGPKKKTRIKLGHSKH